MNDLPVIPFESEAAWEQWLEEHLNDEAGLWLKLAKKGSGHASITYAEALTIALCFGWIDGQKKKFDESFWLQRFTPRRKKSVWSQRNREQAITLIEAGRMRESGLREVERAKADGRWENAYAPQSEATVPDDLQAALDQNEAAKTFFETLNKTNRFAILSQIGSAKREATRQRRIDKFVTMLAANKKLYD